MRRVEVTAPAGKGADVAEVAHSCGISEVSVAEKESHKAGSKPKKIDVVDMNVSTPESKAFLAALFKAPFFDRREYHIGIREPRSVLTSESRREVTNPLAAPLLDIDEELWQFTHVTYSFVLRVFISSALLAYGMIEENWLFMAAGLIFLPFMPLILAVSYGALTREMRLVGHGVVAFVAATLIIIAAGAAVALCAEPPLLFDDFPPMIAGVIFSALIGIAAVLATADDVGHRQLVGLAAASQLALLPVWFGVSLVYGFTESVSEKLLSFGANVLALTVAAAAVYAFLSAHKESTPQAKYAKRSRIAAEKA